MLTVLWLGGLRVVMFPNDHRPAHVHVPEFKGLAIRHRVWSSNVALSEQQLLPRWEIACVAGYPKDIYPREVMKQAGLAWAGQRTRFTSPELEEAVAKRLQVPAEHREFLDNVGTSKLTIALAFLLKNWKEGALKSERWRSSTQMRSPNRLNAWMVDVLDRESLPAEGAAIAAE
jgi:hypothetical protein